MADRPRCGSRARLHWLAGPRSNPRRPVNRRMRRPESGRYPNPTAMQTSSPRRSASHPAHCRSPPPAAAGSGRRRRSSPGWTCNCADRVPGRPRSLRRVRVPVATRRRAGCRTVQRCNRPVPAGAGPLRRDVPLRQGIRVFPSRSAVLGRSPTLRQTAAGRRTLRQAVTRCFPAGRQPTGRGRALCGQFTGGITLR